MKTTVGLIAQACRRSCSAAASLDVGEAAVESSRDTVHGNSAPPPRARRGIDVRGPARELASQVLMRCIAVLLTEIGNNILCVFRVY
jgi:hypothetical protein